MGGERISLIMIARRIESRENAPAAAIPTTESCDAVGSAWMSVKRPCVEASPNSSETPVVLAKALSVRDGCSASRTGVGRGGCGLGLGGEPMTIWRRFGAPGLALPVGTR